MKKIIKLLCFFAFLLSMNISYSQINGITPENPQNEYDYLGKQHNDGLNYFISKNPNLDVETFNKVWQDQMSDFLTSLDYKSETFFEIYNNEQVMNQIGALNTYKNQTPSQELNYFHEKGLINDAKYENYLKMYNLVSTIDELIISEKGDAAKVYSIFKEKMLVIEDEISKLEENDKIPCLMVAAIGRYSVYYWLNEATLNESVWHVPNCSTLGFKFSWSGLGWSDLAGAVGGATRYGVAALFGGPATWSACGIAALSTGLGASAGFAASQLLQR